MKPPAPLDKRKTLLAFLEKGVTMVHLDARRPGVQVPPAHADDAHLTLNLSYRYGIPDFVIGDDRVQATLSFGGRPFQCQLPWTAIFGITSHVSGEGQVWPEDLPSEEDLQASQHRAQTSGRGLARPKPAPRLVAVEGGAGDRAVAEGARKGTASDEHAEAGSAEPAQVGETDRPASGEDPPKPAGRSHLRLIR